MTINNANISGYNHSSGLNTEMNDSLKNLNHSLSNQENPHSGVVISEAVFSHTNSISLNIRQANEQITITQTATISISIQNSILGQVNEKLSSAKEGLPNIDSAFNLFKEIQKLMSDLDSIASSTTHNGETILQSSSTDSSKNQALMAQLSSFVIKQATQEVEQEEILDFDLSKIVAGNLGVEGIASGELLKLKGDETSTSEPLSLLEQIRSYEQSGDIEKSWNAKKEFESYIQIKQDFITEGIEQLKFLQEFFKDAQKGIETSIKDMTNENKNHSHNPMESVDFAKESLEFDKSYITSLVGSFSLSQSNYVTKKSMNLI